jgi:hypothetical protein
MKEVSLLDLQASVVDKSAFATLSGYSELCQMFLRFLEISTPTRIVSPTHKNYIFYQYGKEYGYRITRPLNIDLFIESTDNFRAAFDRFCAFLSDIRKYQEKTSDQKSAKKYIETKEINKVVYTIQQAAGSIGDSFENPNQSRKRVGQLFETLIKLIIQELGLECEPRTIKIPIPGYPGYEMPYELDIVFSRNKAIMAAETKFIDATEIVGSIKTTSKDRIDKVFLDKYLLTKLLCRNIRVVAVFLHDVQRAKHGTSIFGVNSTFKSNHFLGYTVALNRLDGVYYVDPRPGMIVNEKLREQISDLQTFLVRDLWRLSTGD